MGSYKNFIVDIELKSLVLNTPRVMHSTKIFADAILPLLEI